VARNVKRWREGNQPLDSQRTLGSREEVPTHQGYQEILLLKERLNPSRIQQMEVRTVEVALKPVAGRLTVPNIESRCNQLKLGHPRGSAIRAKSRLVAKPDIWFFGDFTSTVTAFTRT
jgi:hypothetical protein